MLTKTELIKEIKGFYNDVKEDRANHFEARLLEMDSDDANDRFGWCENEKLRRNLIWCEYEELPSFIAYLLFSSGIDMFRTISDFFNEQRHLDREASEDYQEIQEEYERMQGWK